MMDTQLSKEEITLDEVRALKPAEEHLRVLKIQEQISQSLCAVMKVEMEQLTLFLLASSLLNTFVSILHEVQKHQELAARPHQRERLEPKNQAEHEDKISTLAEHREREERERKSRLRAERERIERARVAQERERTRLELLNGRIQAATAATHASKPAPKAPKQVTRITITCPRATNFLCVLNGEQRRLMRRIQATQVML
jgi:hypothetical protein